MHDPFVNIRRIVLFWKIYIMAEPDIIRANLYVCLLSVPLTSTTRNIVLSEIYGNDGLLYAIGSVKGSSFWSMDLM